MSEAFIVGGVRTPIGRYGGTLSTVRPDDLAALVIKELVERTGIPPLDITDIVFGAANQAGEDNRNVARMAALLAGLPVTVPGITVNRLCASDPGAMGARKTREGLRATRRAGGYIDRLALHQSCAYGSREVDVFDVRDRRRGRRAGRYQP